MLCIFSSISNNQSSVQNDTSLFTAVGPESSLVLTAPLATHPSRRHRRLNEGQEVVGWRRTSWQTLHLSHSGRHRPLHLLDPCQIYLQRGHSALVVSNVESSLNQREASPFRRMASLLKRSDMKSPPLDAAATAAKTKANTNSDQRW